MVRQVSFPAPIPKMRMLLLLGVIGWHVTNAEPLPLARNVDDCFSCNGLFQEIAKRRSDDFVCSPINAAMDLSMLAVGAKSTSRKQLYSVLGIANEIEFPQYLSTIRPFIDSFANYDHVNLRLAQKMFLASGYEAKFEFVSGIINNFRSNIEAIDVGHPQDARKTINDWIAGEANDFLNNTLSLDYIDDKTAIILVSVAYFRGEWRWPFIPYELTPRKFWVHGVEPVFPLTMFSIGTYKYGEIPEVDAKFIEIPYESKSEADAVSMFIILPNERTGVDSITNNFDKVDSELRIGGSPTPLDLYLPKFEIQSTIDLAEPLDRLSVTEMFSRTADFRGISPGPRLKVTGITQKVVIKVDEGGTEAAAAVEALSVGADDEDTGHPTNIEFNVDRPFVFVIKARAQVTLFAGVVSSGEGFKYQPGENGPCCT